MGSWLWNKMDIEKYKGYSPILLRVTVSLIFLWFGLNLLFDTANWLGWLPQWVFALPLSSELFLKLNGGFQAVFGLLLLLGYFTRVSALLLSLHLFGIAVNLGYNDIFIRDLGLSLITFSVFLRGPDRFCMKKNIKAEVQ